MYTCTYTRAHAWTHINPYIVYYMCVSKFNTYLLKYAICSFALIGGDEHDGALRRDGAPRWDGAPRLDGNDSYVKLLNMHKSDALSR